MVNSDKKISNQTREKLLASVVVTPAILMVVLVLVWPLLYSIWLSLTNTGVNPSAGVDFIWFENYIRVFSSSGFYASAWRTIYFVTISLAIQLPIGLLISVLLNTNFYGRNFLRAIILVPWAVPTIVNGALWSWIYQAQYGALNGLLFQLGLIKQPILWLGSPQLAMNMVIVADTWKVLPFYIILFLAGLQTIPNQLYEAASVDGANYWQKFWKITFPYLQPILLVILVLRTMDTFRVFDLIYQLTQGGPAGGTIVMAYYAYMATFLRLQFGYGASISFVIASVVLVLALIYIRILKTRDL